MATTTHKRTPTGSPIHNKIEKTQSRDHKCSNECLGRFQTKPTGIVSKTADGKQPSQTGPSPLVTERKTILRHGTNSQDSIGGRLSSVGPIPACGLDDWKYNREQLRQQDMESLNNPSPSSSLNLLRLPLGQLNNSGMGASCASLLVHAPSLSRISGQTDNDFSAPEEESFSSALWTHKPLDYIDPAQSGCPVCYRGEYSFNQTDSSAFMVRSRSMCPINLSELDTGFVEQNRSIPNTYRPNICLLHKTRGWNYNPSGTATVPPSKTSACSISMPSIHMAMFHWNSKTVRETTIPATPTMSLQPNVDLDQSLSLSTSKRKCESWLSQSWR